MKLDPISKIMECLLFALVISLSADLRLHLWSSITCWSSHFSSACNLVGKKVWKIFCVPVAAHLGNIPTLIGISTNAKFTRMPEWTSHSQNVLAWNDRYHPIALEVTAKFHLKGQVLWSASWELVPLSDKICPLMRSPSTATHRKQAAHLINIFKRMMTR